MILFLFSGIYSRCIGYPGHIPVPGTNAALYPVCNRCVSVQVKRARTPQRSVLMVIAPDHKGTMRETTSAVTISLFMLPVYYWDRLDGYTVKPGHRLCVKQGRCKAQRSHHHRCYPHPNPVSLQISSTPARG